MLHGNEDFHVAWLAVVLVYRVGNKSHKCDNQMAEINKQLKNIKDLIECVAEKASNIELRQSHSSGEANDAVRAVQQ